MAVENSEKEKFTTKLISYLITYPAAILLGSLFALLIITKKMELKIISAFRNGGQTHTLFQSSVVLGTAYATLPLLLALFIAAK